MDAIKVPGAVWIVALLLIPDLIEMIQPFSEQYWWINIVVGVLLLLYKGYTVYYPQTKTNIGPDYMPTIRQESKINRFMWG